MPDAAPHARTDDDHPRRCGGAVRPGGRGTGAVPVGTTRRDGQAVGWIRLHGMWRGATIQG
jgi:hypothetical protein